MQRHGNAIAEKAKRLRVTGLHCVPRHELDVTDVFEKMVAYSNKNHQEKRAWLGTIFNSSQRSRTDKHKERFSSGLPHHHALCNTCFMKYNGIPRTTFFRIKRDSKRGALRILHGNTSKKKTRRRTHAAMAWVEEYAKGAGDVMPDTGDIHLPDYRWKHVWAKMTAAMALHREVPPSLSGFRKAAKIYVPHVKIVKVKRFAKCTTCDKLDTLIGKSSGQVRSFYVAEKEAHNSWQQRERNKYYKHRDKSRSHFSKHKCLSIAMDSMDHGKTSIPKRPRDDKDADGCNKLITHITGVLIHGRDPKAIGYTWYDRFPAGSDVTMTILLDALNRVTGPLPPTLYLQMDNCSRENKNQYVMALATLLVERGVFRKVKISFLPVGHTHDDPDQMFSCFNRAFSAHVLYVLDHIATLAKASYEPTPLFVHLDDMGSYSTLLKPYLKKFEGITKPRVFRIKRDDDGVVRCHYRMQMQTQTQDLGQRVRRWVLDIKGDGAGHESCRAVHVMASGDDTTESAITKLRDKTANEECFHEVYYGNELVGTERRLQDLYAGDLNDANCVMFYPMKAAPTESTWMPRNSPGFTVFKDASRPDLSKLVRHTR